MDLGTEPVGWNFLVGVVVLKDVSDSSEGLEVLVLVGVLVVQRIVSSWRTVGKGEVNRDVEVDFTATENIFQEIYSPFDLKL